MLNLTINNLAITAEEGSTILDAATSAGIHIPTLCYLKDQNAIASCRICSVEIEGSDSLVTACNTPVSEGMNIATDTEKVKDWRHIALELILADVDLSLIEEDRELKVLCRELGVSDNGAFTKHSNESILDSNPFLQYNPQACIRCERCVGACNSVACNHSLQPGKQGTRTTILAPFGENWKSTACESCGNCAQACPTGAIRPKSKPFPSKGKPATAFSGTPITTTCPHCGVGCQLTLEVLEGKIVGAEGAPGASNDSRLCVKGRFASFNFVDSSDRIRTPLIKNQETGTFEEASWDEALDLVASKFTAIKDQYGGEALAAFACSRSTNEDVYLFQKMGRVAFETNNIDNCARV